MKAKVRTLIPRISRDMPVIAVTCTSEMDLIKMKTIRCRRSPGGCIGGDENRIYFFKNNPDRIVWCDASLRKFEKTSFTAVERTDEVILGHKCKKVTLRSESSTVTYYFSDAYPLDPRGFAQHFFDSWNLYTSLAKAVPLKVVLEVRGMKLTSTAIRMESKPIDRSVFEVPKGILKEMHN